MALSSIDGLKLNYTFNTVLEMSRPLHARGPLKASKLGINIVHHKLGF